MSCKDYKNKLELYIDNELSSREKAEFEKHLSSCHDCMRELEILKSVNSLGKIDTFSEPEEEYWNELSQNIIHQIGGHKSKTAWLVHHVEQLKRMLTIPKISYRWVGLAATAVIVFFIIHISFFRQGKFELPIEIGTEDAVKIADQKSISDVLQDKIFVDKETNEKTTEKQIAPEPRLTKVSAPKQKSRQITKSESISKPARAIVDEVKAIPSVPGEVVVIEETNERLTSNTATQSLKKSTVPKKEMKRFTVQPTAINLEKGKNDASIEIVATGLKGKSNQLSDSSFIYYNEILKKVQQIEEISEKIKTWENFIKSKPNLALLRKAKYQQALLYYKLAKLNHVTEEIKKAINFYLENAELLFSPENADYLNKKLEELNFLLKKSEKIK